MKYFDKDLLQEFMCRTLTTLNDKVKILLQSTNILTKYPQFYLESRFTESPNRRNPPDIYLVINYKNGQYQFGHLTFHLVHFECNYATSNGPLHVVNNTSTRKRRQLAVENTSIRNCKSIRISIGKRVTPPHNISDDITEITNAILSIFNEWFNLSKTTSLIYQNCQLDNIIHNHKYNHKLLTNTILKEKVSEILSWRSSKKQQRGGLKLKTKITQKIRKHG